MSDNKSDNKSDRSSKPPNLYHLLGLKPLESDPTVITAAIERLKKRLEPASSLSAEDRTRIERVIALGEKYLLDSNNKAAYDRQWQAAYQVTSSESPRVQSSSTNTHSTNAHTTNSHTAVTNTAAKISTTAVAVASDQQAALAWDDAGLAALLPAGDPQAPFDMQGFLASSPARDPLAAEADLSKLIAILSQSDAGNTAASAANDARPTHQSSTQPASLDAQADSKPSARMRPVQTVDRSRQSKQRSIVIGGISLVAGVGGLVLLGLYLTQGTPSASSQLTSSTGAAASTGNSSSSPAATGAADPRANAPRRSGLPQPGESQEMPASVPLEITASPAPPETPPAGMSTESMSAGSTPTASTSVAPTPAPTPSVSNMTTGADTTKPAPATGPSKDQPASAPLAGTPPAGTPPTSNQPLTDQERTDWQSGMNAARQSLSKLDIGAADSQLKKLSESIKNVRQREQWQRLSEVAGFIKDVREAMVAAIAGLSGGDTFKIGTSTVVSFIAGDENKIVVRLAGTRREFPLAEMPVAMGVALIDLKMDVAKADSLVRKGAYILLHPKNDVMAQRGKSMLADAAQAGAITVELSKFYEDDYSVAQ